MDYVDNRSEHDKQLSDKLTVLFAGRTIDHVEVNNGKMWITVNLHNRYSGKYTDMVKSQARLYAGTMTIDATGPNGRSLL